MNWGIVTLLGFIGFVLAGVAAFFVYLGRRTAALPTLEARTSAGHALLPSMETDVTGSFPAASIPSRQRSTASPI